MSYLGNVVDAIMGKSQTGVDRSIFPPKGKVMICDKGDMRIIPDCHWEGGEECSGLKQHYYNEYDGCCSKGKWFCVRAGVHRRCINTKARMEESFRQLYPDEAEGK